MPNKWVKLARTAPDSQKRCAFARGLPTELAIREIMEVEHEDPRRDGFFFDPQAFRLELYRLLGVFYSSASFVKHQAKASELADLAGEFEAFEVTRLLVNIAATVRIVSDRERAFFRQLKLHCGQLTEDLKKPKKKELLTLREACNKILHATKFNFDVRFVSVPGDRYNSSIVLV